MTPTEMVTDFKLRDGDKPTTVAELMRALNTYLNRIGLQPEEYGFRVSALIGYSPSEASQRIPENYRWLVAFAIEGCEGYWIHVVAIDSATQTYADLGIAKTYSADNAYALAREAQRFLTAAAWN